MSSIARRTLVLRSLRRRAALSTALAVLVAAAGCDQGTVVANGHVMVEGQPVSSGRLSLTPLGGGPRAFSAVAEDGAFSLRATGEARGAVPGSYRVFFQQPLDAQTRTRIARKVAGQLAPDELTVSYRSPRDKSLVIPESGDESLVIDIRQDEGWTRSLNE